MHRLELQLDAQFDQLQRLQQDLSDTNRLLLNQGIRTHAIELACEEEFATLHHELDQVELHVGLRKAEPPTLRVIQ